MNRDELTPEQQAELDDKIFAAKKRAERAGYKVIMPGEGGNTTPAQEPATQTAQTGKPTHTMSRQAYAQRVGGPANRLSMADRLSQLAQAAKTAEEAGYRVRKATPEERAALKAQQTAPAANPAPATAANPAPAPAATPAPETTPAAPPAEPPKPAEPEKKPNPYFAAAARFCKQED
jgi:hypothetical protein